jgi:hypothetical protein
MMRVVSRAAALVLLSGPASADPTTTEQVDQVRAHLLEEATCREVLDTFAGYEEDTTSDRLLILLALSFGHGYAQAKGIKAHEAWGEISLRCLENPDLPFAMVPE